MTAERFCNQCGHRNPSAANFCSSCGSLLAPGEDLTISLHAGDHTDPSLKVHVDHQSPAVLVLRHGGDAGESFVLADGISAIGRNPESTVFLDDVTVSRRHAEVVATPEGHKIRDCGSLNGTYVNRERIAEVQLRAGDDVQIGKFRLVFLSAEA